MLDLVKQYKSECDRLKQSISESDRAGSSCSQKSKSAQNQIAADENVFLKCELNCEKQQNQQLQKRLESIQSENERLKKNYLKRL